MSPFANQKTREQLLSDLRWTRLVSAATGMVNVVLAFLVLWLILVQRTHIMPPAVDRPYWVAGGAASREYLIDQANYVLGTYLNTTPANIEHNTRELLRLADSAYYPSLKSQFDADIERIKRDAIASVWAPNAVAVDAPRLAIQVSGVLATYIADRKTSERPKTYLVQFRISPAGRLYVIACKDITNVQGTPDAAAATLSDARHALHIGAGHARP